MAGADRGTLGKETAWLLPEGADEVLPPRAMALERLRQRTIECCFRWGYELISPPAIEYLDSLLTGSATDLDVQTFKLTDHLSGRLMGVPADMTPQAARVDAHQLRSDLPVRLCYAGTVLQTRPQGPTGSRNPLQIGAELYGHAGVESDAEVIALMLEQLTIAGVGDVHLDLGHVGVFRGLAREAGLSAATESALWEALQRKATSEIEALLSAAAVPEPHREMLAALATFTGGVEILDKANERLAGAGEVVHQALAALWSIAGALERWAPEVALHFDLAELRGYQYHTGVVFAALVPGHGEEIARGGRYDGIGRVFGRARPATGFSADLKALFGLVERPIPHDDAVAAPWQDDPALAALVRALRDSGERVLWLLPGQEEDLAGMGCDRYLARGQSGDWLVVPWDGGAA